jgi:hypothetical protein
MTLEHHAEAGEAEGVAAPMTGAGEALRTGRTRGWAATAFAVGASGAGMVNLTGGMWGRAAPPRQSPPGGARGSSHGNYGGRGIRGRGESRLEGGG